MLASGLGNPRAKVECLDRAASIPWFVSLQQIKCAHGIRISSGHTGGRRENEAIATREAKGLQRLIDIIGLEFQLGEFDVA